MNINNIMATLSIICLITASTLIIRTISKDWTLFRKKIKLKLLIYTDRNGDEIERYYYINGKPTTAEKYVKALKQQYKDVEYTRTIHPKLKNAKTK